MLQWSGTGRKCRISGKEKILFLKARVNILLQVKRIPRTELRAQSGLSIVSHTPTPPPRVQEASLYLPPRLSSVCPHSTA
jgi:hypothetical protein